MAATTSELAQIKSIAATNGVSWQSLLGIFGAESDYGTNEGPSSAGAEGPFQFLPPDKQPTIDAEYGITNTTIWQFGPSLDAAAKYLKKLGATTSPTSPQTFAALNAYNGNSSGSNPSAYTNSVLAFGLSTSQYDAMEKNAMSNVNGPGLNLPADIKSGADAVGNVFSGLQGFLNTITSPKTWVAAGGLILGLGVILIALHRQTGVGLPRAVPV